MADGVIGILFFRPTTCQSKLRPRACGSKSFPFLKSLDCQPVRQISSLPVEGDNLEDFRLIRIERHAGDALRLLVNLNDKRIMVFLENDKGETIDRIYG